MKLAVAFIVASFVCAAPASAQLGNLGDRLKKAQEAKGKFDKQVAEIKISDADERKLGEEVSAKLRQEFGVYQDRDVTKYGSLVGKGLEQSISRQSLDWQFICVEPVW